MKKIIIDEDNFNDVLERLKKICKNRFMICCYKEKWMKKKTHGSYKKGKDEFKFKRILSIDKIYPVKHPRRVKIEGYSKDEFLRQICNELNCLIYLEGNYENSNTICEGDKIQFLPFGGFILYVTIHPFASERPDYVIKYLFLPFIKSKRY